MSSDAMKVLGLVVAIGGALACDDEPASRPELDAGEVDGEVDGELDGGEHDTTEPAEAVVEVDEDADGGPQEVEADVPDDGAVDADGGAEVDAGEVDADDGEVEPEPRACDDFEACDEWPDEAGICHGTCRSTDDTLRCTGAVEHGVCHALPSRVIPTEAVDFGDFTVTPVSWPADTRVGETHDLVIRVDNDGAAALSIPFRWKAPDVFSFSEVSWEGLEAIALEPGQSALLTAKITAAKANVFSIGGDIIATFVFDEQAFEPRAVVRFAETEPIACGGEYFPESWCAGEGCHESRSYYVSARCCDEVFFPGALCCDDTDCLGGGACVDGKCVFGVPALASADDAPIGHQIVRLVLVDSHPQFADPCADHYEEARHEIDFATVESWYDDLARRRLGRDALDLRWVVTGGVATSDFLTGPNWWADYSRELDAWLEARGCPLFGGAYDKVIVASSTVELMGYGGVYQGDGQIAVHSPYNAYLLAHELAHAFGATDLYLDLGGTLLYPNDLMGNQLSGPPHPGDKVAWGEMGFADLDRNGVIDVVELAAFPESLAVVDVRATITGKGTIEIGWEFRAVEDGVDKHVIVPRYGIEVPAAEASLEQSYAGRRKVVVFDETQLDLVAIEQAGVIEVTITATHRFTDRDWARRTLDLNQTLEVPVSVER